MPRLVWLDDLRRDVAYGFRTLARTPGFTVVSVLTLALGIGAVTVIYSVLRDVVLDPFPYAHADRMVDVVLKDSSGRIVRGPYFPAPEFLDYQEQSRAFEDVIGTSLESVHWFRDGGAERVTIAWMTPNGFAFLGVPALLGRVFGTADGAPDASPVAVLNHRTWMTLFGGDPSVVGRTIVLNDEPRTIVGIMPPRFEWNVADFWLPSVLSRTDDPQLPKGSRAFQARLRRGVSIKEAEAELQVIAARRATDHPPEYPPHFRIEVITVIDWVVRDFRGVLYTLFGAVSLLLVISCCNVANMLLARATSREREISIRAAIGASRGRIVRQLLVESGLLAVGGLVVGCLLAYGGIAALARFMPRQGVPWETELRLDQPVLVFALIAAAIATIGFGLFPAVQSARADVSVGIDTGGRGTAGRRQTRMRSGLVIAQVALSIVLLLGAGVLMRTFVKLAKVDLGFDARNILLTGVSLPPRNGASAADRTRLWQQLLDRVRTIPSVASAGISSGPPFGGIRSPLQIPGVAVPEQSFAFVTASSDGLLETIGVPLVRGRHVSRADVEASRHVAVVNETLATKFFAVNDALGRTIRLPRLAAIPAPIADPTFEIVGIVRDTANLGPRELPAPQVFVPFTLRPATGVTFVVRTSDNPMRFVNGVRVEAQVVDRQIALVDPTTMEDFVQRVFFARPRFSVLVLGIFACTGVVLVAFGVYGVLSYTVSQRSREIAIRMALGGDHRDVILMVLRLGASLVGAGVLVGIAVSAVTNRLLVTQLWNTSPHDAMTLAVTVAVVVTVGVFACWVPARRAVRIEPMAALRHE